MRDVEVGLVKKFAFLTSNSRIGAHPLKLIGRKSRADKKGDTSRRV